MPAIVVPKTRVLTGPGYLYRAPLGTLLPGQTSATVTNKAKTSGVATLTTSASHGFTTGKKIFVSIGDAGFDGLQTVASAPTATTLTFNAAGADVTSGASTGTILSYDAGGTVAGSVFTDAWPSGWVPIGVTKEGHEFSYAPSTGNVEVAEYLAPLAIVTESVELKVSFEIAEFTAKNLAFGLNGATVSTVSGTGATQLVELVPPAVGAEVRQMIGWEAGNSTERAVYVQAFQSGTLSVAHKKGTDNSTISVEFSLEEPSAGPAFRRFYAGSVPVGS